MNLDNLKKPAHMREMMLALIFYFALLLMFLRIFYWPHQEAFKILSEKVSSMQLEKEALEKFASASQVHQQEENLLMTKPSSPKTQILSGKKPPLAKTLSSLFSQITQQAFTGDLTLDSLSQLAKVNQNGYSKTPFTLNAHGTFDSALAFVDKLDHFEALITIDTLSLSLEAQHQNDVSMELTVNYYQLEDVHEQTPPVQK